MRKYIATTLLLGAAAIVLSIMILWLAADYTAAYSQCVKSHSPEVCQHDLGE